MNKQGEMKGIGIFLVVFITVIVGLAIYGAVVELVGSSTTTVDYNTTTGHGTVTLANNTFVNLEGKLASGFYAYFANDSRAVDAGNYTVRNNQIDSTTGELTADVGGTTTDATVEGVALNVSYNYQPVGYINDSGSRAMTGLIAVFMALAVLVIVFVVFKDSGFN